jgi:hypothetical protein
MHEHRAYLCVCVCVCLWCVSAFESVSVNDSTFVSVSTSLPGSFSDDNNAWEMHKLLIL